MPYLIRVASYSVDERPAAFSINVHPGGGNGPRIQLAVRPGSLQIDITGGPPLGGYFLAVTFFPGVYPDGWLFGVDLPLPELQNLLTLGAPFLAPLGACGRSTIGPFGGLGFLSGIPIYRGRAGHCPSGLAAPSVHSPAVTYTIP